MIAYDIMYMDGEMGVLGELRYFATNIDDALSFVRFTEKPEGTISISITKEEKDNDAT